MTMTPAVRKFMLTAHITASVGWVGTLTVFFVHALAGLISQDEQIVRSVSLAMGITAWFVILPLSLASFLTGLVQALGTAWGLLRHYWVVFKLLLTTVATIVLLLKLEPISSLVDTAKEATFSSTDLIGLRTSLVVHTAGGLLVLLAATALAVYKPVGMTRYGILKRHEGGGATLESEFGSLTKTPRWVKIFGVALIILLMLVGIMLLGGGHGPGAHLPSNGA